MVMEQIVFVLIKVTSCLILKEFKTLPSHRAILERKNLEASVITSFHVRMFDMKTVKVRNHSVFISDSRISANIFCRRRWWDLVYVGNNECLNYFAARSSLIAGSANWKDGWWNSTCWCIVQSKQSNFRHSFQNILKLLKPVLYTVNK